MFVNYIDHADNENNNAKLELALVSKLQGVHLIIFHYNYILFAFIVNPFPYRLRSSADGRQSDEVSGNNSCVYFVTIFSPGP